MRKGAEPRPFFFLIWMDGRLSVGGPLLLVALSVCLLPDINEWKSLDLSVCQSRVALLVAQISSSGWLS